MEVVEASSAEQASRLQWRDRLTCAAVPRAGTAVSPGKETESETRRTEQAQGRSRRIGQVGSGWDTVIFSVCILTCVVLSACEESLPDASRFAPAKAADATATGDAGTAQQGAPCDDGNACTESDSLTAGGSCSGTAKGCDDANVCTTDTCDKKLGCVFTAAVICDDKTPCQSAKCDPLSGMCTTQPGADGSPCDDGNQCTSLDLCSGGACQGKPLDCDDQDPCRADSCNPATGCQHIPTAAPCSDGDNCTLGDSCINGACAPGSPKSCEDSNVCTQDACQGGACINTASLGTCDDDNDCTKADTCANGKCSGPVAVDCNDANPCTLDTCEIHGGCQHPAGNLGQACDDESACTVKDVCSGKMCVGSPLTCDDGEACTQDGCDPKAGCTALPKDATCSDDNVCTTGDGCLAGKCVAPGLLACADNNPCTADSCDKASGCQFVPLSAAATCSDASACTVGDQCVADKCVGVAVQCVDNLPCTADSCDPFIGCTYLPQDATCTDGDACTVGDACTGGACTPTGKQDCADADPCTAEACDALKGCQYPAVATPTGCDDGSACTKGDVCVGFNCVGGAIACNDDNQCTADGCDPKTGCVFAFVATSCDDKDACTAADQCGKGVCAGSAIGCDDNEPCTTDACNKSTGCTHAPNAAACTDGQACTVGDACVGGACKAGSPAIWESSWGGPAQEYLRDLTVGADGTMVGVGYRKSNALETDTLVMSFDSKGSAISKDIVFGVPGIDMALACTVTSDGSVAGVGTVEYAGFGTHVWVGRMVGTQFKYDNFLWGLSESLYDVAALADGGLIAVGKVVTAGGGPKSDALAARFDAGNLLVWNPIPAFGLAGDDAFLAVAAAPDGNLLMAGIWGSGSVNVGDTTQAWMIKLDKFGKSLWSKQYGGAGFDTALDVAIASDGSYLWSGLSSTESAPNGSASAAWLLKTNGSGTILWERKFAVAMSNAAAKLPMWPTADGGAVAALRADDQNLPRMVQVDGAGKVVQDVLLTWAPSATIQSIAPSANGWILAGYHSKAGEAINFWIARTDPLFHTTCAGAGACFGKIASACDDANVCTADQCEPASGACSSGTPDKCDDGDACTVDSCDKVSGCQHAPDLVKCDDGNSCTIDACVQLLGCSHSAKVCDDGNVCTVDGCDVAKGCTKVAAGDGVGCTDGNACTVGDGCLGGVCISGGAKQCAATEVCVLGECKLSIPAGMAHVPAGAFQMGCPAGAPCWSFEKPQHTVTLSAFFIDKTEVTVAAYKKCVDAGKCSAPSKCLSAGTYSPWGVAGKEQLPVVCVTWQQSDAYCHWTAPNGRLPTEAEWEKAARGNVSGKLYPWGDDWPPPAMAANLADKAFGICDAGPVIQGYDDGVCGLAPVGQFSAANGYGLADIAGNVWEWTADWHQENYYTISPPTDPQGPATGTQRVARGGGFVTSDKNELRSSYRAAAEPSEADGYLGFRCARSL